MRWLIIGISLFLAVWPRFVQAQPQDCSTPRRAADMLFYWQQPDSMDIERATTCLDAAGRTAGELQSVARKVKRLFDNRGMYVDMTALSDDPQFAVGEGERRVALHHGLPSVVLSRADDGRWLWTAASLSTVERLYDDETGMLQRFVVTLPESLQEQLFGVHLWQYLGLAMLLLVGLMLRAVIRMLIESRVRKLAEVLGAMWASTLARASAAPLSTIAMAAGLRVTYPMLMLPVSFAAVLAISVRVLMVLAIVWGLYRLVDLVAESLAERAARTESKLDDQLVPLVRKSLKVFVVIGGVLFVLQNLQVDVGSLLTGLGIGGLAFALAAKETLANFFGSLMIFVDRPFQIGDWIAVRGAEGIVEEVGFRSTRIRTFYNSVISVPNAAFTDAQIDNYGRREYRRTFTTLNLTYDTTPEQMQAFCEGIRAIIVANPFTRKDYYEVHMSAFGAHSLDVMVYFFFKVPSWSDELRERHNVFLEIMRLAEALGVQFAFPTQTLHVDSVAAPGVARQVPAPPPHGQLAQVVRDFGPEGQLSRPAPGELVSGAFLAQK